jgi:hypothetical protein
MPDPRPAAIPRAACCWLVLLLGACATTRPGADLPPDFSDEYELDEGERRLDPPAVLAAARDLIVRRQEEGDALEHAAALLHHYRKRKDHASAELDTLLAEVHARIADALDLQDTR